VTKERVTNEKTFRLKGISVSSDGRSIGKETVPSEKIETKDGDLLAYMEQCFETWNNGLSINYGSNTKPSIREVMPSSIDSGTISGSNISFPIAEF
jgi:hypothetical protein